MTASETSLTISALRQRRPTRLTLALRPPSLSASPNPARVALNAGTSPNAAPQLNDKTPVNSKALPSIAIGRPNGIS